MNNFYIDTIRGLSRLTHRKMALLTQWAISLWKLAKVLSLEKQLGKGLTSGAGIPHIYDTGSNSEGYEIANVSIPVHNLSIDSLVLCIIRYSECAYRCVHGCKINNVVEDKCADDEEQHFLFVNEIFQKYETLAEMKDWNGMIKEFFVRKIRV